LARVDELAFLDAIGVQTFWPRAMQRAVRTAMIAVASMLVSVRSVAADGQTVQWPWLFDKGVQYLVGVRAKLSAPSRPLIFQEPSQGVFGRDLHLVLLVRNRGSTSWLAGGDRRSAVDFAGVRRSTRMAVERLALSGGVVQPFAQVGVGYWRRDVDRRFFGDQWYCAQYGGGLELRVSPGASLALEGDHALLRNPTAELKSEKLSIRSAFLGLQVRLP
jgi:hypothetical protein